MCNLFYLKEYSPFKSKKEFNEATAEHMARINYDINETDRTVFILLSQYAFKYNGVAHLKADTLAKKVGKSTITIRRSINKLVNLGVIKKQTFIRKVSGGNGANLLIFMPVGNDDNLIDEEVVLPCDDNAKVITREDNEKPTDGKDSHEDYRNNPINYLSTKDINSYTYVDTPYSRFKHAVSTFKDIRDNSYAETVYKLYGVYLAQTKALRKAYTESELIDVAISAIHDTFHATKRKDIRNIFGYYNGVISNKIDAMYAELVAELRGGY